MNKKLKKLLSEYKKLQKRSVTVKLSCIIDLAWRSDESYDVDCIEKFGVEKVIKKYEIELKNFCRRVDIYGKKYHNDKWYVWKNYIWQKS